MQRALKQLAHKPKPRVRTSPFFCARVVWSEFSGLCSTKEHVGITTGMPARSLNNPGVAVHVSVSS